MVTPPNPKLSVAVIGLAFSQGESAKLTLSTALSVDPRAQCCLVLPPEEPFVLQPWWNTVSDHALLVLRDVERLGPALALKVVHAQDSGPLAVLIGLPQAPWSLRNLFAPKEDHPVVAKIRCARQDIQVHICNASWSTRPPRIL